MFFFFDFDVNLLFIFELIWLDYDTYIINNLETLFLDENYLKFGSLFWPDMHDSFQTDKLYKKLSIIKMINYTTFAKNNYKMIHPFESGNIDIVLFLLKVG